MQKYYIHINEYDLTRIMIEKLDIEIEGTTLLMNGMCELTYNGKDLLFPQYGKTDRYDNAVIFQPFSVDAHSGYLINLFDDVYNCESRFEYRDYPEKPGTLIGTLNIRGGEYHNNEYSFHGLTNPSCIKAALILKCLTGPRFKDFIGKIFKIDDKINAAKKR